jgi:excisionase family DNA binding protein
MTETHNAATALDDQLLDVGEAATVLRVSHFYIRDHATRLEPKIPHVRFGRRILFRRSDLREFVEAHAKKG